MDGVRMVMGAPRLNASARGQAEALTQCCGRGKHRRHLKALGTCVGISVSQYTNGRRARQKGSAGGTDARAAHRTGYAGRRRYRAFQQRAILGPPGFRAAFRLAGGSAAVMTGQKNGTPAPPGGPAVVLSDMEADPLCLSAVQPAGAEPSSTVLEPLGAEAGQPVADRRLRRAQAGDMGAFRDLIRAHQDAIYTLALHLLGVREDAEDLAQDVFVALHRHLAAITSPAHLRFWLRRTVCHRAIDRLRRRSALANLPLEAAAELPAAESDGDPMLQRFLLGLIAELAPMPRAVLLLRFQEDLDPAQIAEVLDVPTNTVKSHLKRSLARLRGLWDARARSPRAGVQS